MQMFLLLICLLFISTNAQPSLFLDKSKYYKTRIVNGKNADISDYPYQVSVLIEGQHDCGGSIISSLYILTAAHCTYERTEKQMSIRAGSSLHNSGGQVVQVAKIHDHPQFDIDTYDYDISVLQLASTLTMGTKVKAITMSSSGSVITNGQNATATGWGRLTNDGEIPNILQVVTLPTITTASCKTYYAGVTERMFCAGYELGGKDTCTGDSGGPLVLGGILIGVTSWGGVCGAAQSPGAYTKISVLRTWVDGIVE